MSSPSSLIEVHDLVKVYGKKNNTVTAVAGTNFTIQKGTCFGLLGPNGAGKTTTIEMLEGIIKPTQGRILYKGIPLNKKQFSQIAGIQFQHTSLQDHLSVLENLKLFASFYKQHASIDDLIQTCALESYLNRDARKLSGGQRQRLLLAIALINDPEMIFLDEPTTGLDPQARRNFWDLVNQIKSKEKTILLTTHYMEEAYALCDEIAIMDHGNIISRGTPDSLLSEHFQESILEIPLSNIHAPLPVEYSETGGFAQIVSEDVDHTVSLLLKAGISLRDLNIHQRTLEDLFIKLTGKGLRD